MPTPPADLSELALFASGPVVLFKWRNAEGWPVDWVSPNVESVFGFSAAQLISGEVAYAQQVHEEDLERVASEVSAAIDEGVVSFEHEPYRIRRADGVYRWLQDVTHLQRTGDEVTHFVGYVVDVTERLEATRRQHALELKLLHGQKLESLGVLAGGVAHDFNNLLTGILGEASLASNALEGVDNEACASIEQIETLARRAADLTRQLLAYSGKGRFVVQSVDLSALLTEISQMLKVVISKKAALELDLAEDLPTIVADRTQLQQVAMNLLTNASEALGDDPGLIRVTTTTEVCSKERLANAYDAPDLPPGTYVVLEVSDNGCGMTADVKSQLFDPFFTTKTHGRGLGMSAILGIMRAHHGAIRVYSEPGHGTAFKLLFPASSLSSDSPPAAETSSSWKGSGLALVVDDEPSVRDVAQRMMRHLGFETVGASDGAEAVRVFEAHRDRVRVVLLDMMMPVMSGRETLSALRALEPNLPIVMSSGFNEQEAITRLAARGMTCFLQKPYQIADLEMALRDVVSAKPTDDP
jgi:PAS domain S-box-containing protein